MNPADRADITLDLGLLGHIDAIVLFRSEPPRITAVYIQINDHLVNIASRFPQEGLEVLLETIFGEQPEPVSTDADELLAEFGENDSFGGTD